MRSFIESDDATGEVKTPELDRASDRVAKGDVDDDDDDDERYINTEDYAVCKNVVARGREVHDDDDEDESTQDHILEDPRRQLEQRPFSQEESLNAVSKPNKREKHKKGKNSRDMPL